MALNLVINDAQIQLWLGTLWLPFVRISAALMVSPLFSSTHIPKQYKIFVAMAVVAVVLPTMPPGLSVNPLGLQGLLLAANEILLGVCLGFLLQLTFEGVTFAGQLISSGMGLSFASMYNPEQHDSAPVLSQYFSLLTWLLFLSFNGHLALLAFLAHSFTAWPVGHSVLVGNTLMLVMSAINEMMRYALQIALPALIALIVVQIALGVVSRSAPALNLFAVGFPITMLIGFMLIQRTLPDLVGGLRHQLDHNFALMQNVLEMQRHGRI